MRPSRSDATHETRPGVQPLTAVSASGSFGACDTSVRNAVFWASSFVRSSGVSLSTSCANAATTGRSSPNESAFMRYRLRAVVVGDQFADAGDRILELGADAEMLRGENAHHEVAFVALEDPHVVADIRQKI